MKKILSLLTLSLILVLTSHWVLASTHNNFTVNQIGAQVWDVQSVTSSTERWFIWDIIANIFHASGRIKTIFLSPFQVVEDPQYHNTLLRWTKTDTFTEWRFEAGTIRDNGDRIGVGTDIDDNYRVNIAGSINFSWDLYKNNSLFSSGKFVDGVNPAHAVYNVWNVGIGTNEPVSLLHVNGNIRAGNITSQNNTWLKGLLWGMSAAWWASILLYGASNPDYPNQISINTWLTPRLRILGNGNVGIWTNTPTERLQVQGNILTSWDTTTRILNTNWGANIGRELNVGYGLDVNYGATIGYGLDVWYGVTIGYWLDVWYGANIARDVTIGRSLTVDTDTFYVNHVSNRVGIGTTTPISSLSNTTLNPADGNNLNAVSGWNKGIVWEANGWFAGTFANIGTNALSQWLQVRINGTGTQKIFAAWIWTATSWNTDRFVVLGNGNVGIWTTSPTERLHVTWNIRATGTISAATPTEDEHVATKGYVDSVAGWWSNCQGYSWTIHTPSCHNNRQMTWPTLQHGQIYTQKIPGTSSNWCIAQCWNGDYRTMQSGN